MIIKALGRTKNRYPGESILISRGDEGEQFQVVVDLGTATAGLAERAAAREPAVVVLTHDDNDHIGGFDAFIGALGSCRPQFWLPADWIFLEVAVSAVETSERYPAPPDPDSPHLTPDQVRTTLSGDGTPLCGFFEDGRNGPWREDVVRLTATPPEPPALREPDGTDDVEGQRELAIITRIAEMVDAHRGVFPRDSPDEQRYWSGTSTEVAERVLARSRTIAHIVRQADRVGTIRWFTVDIEAPGAGSDHPWQSAGWPSVLTLVNAREVRLADRFTVDDPDGTLILLFALTVQNKRALVTHVWPDCGDGADGAIIWSDSDGVIADVAGASGRTPWERTSLMTAPHHGSNQPAHSQIWSAHRKIEHALHPVAVLLSTNMHDTTDQYLNLEPDRRGCTICDYLRPTAPRQEVTALVNPGACTILDACAHRGTNCPNSRRLP